jgi:hypothetical protein
MALNIVALPQEYIPDFNQGRPLFNAQIYVGIPDLDPEIPANRKTVTLRQESGDTVNVPQPIRTSSGGVPTYNGSPAQILVDGNYSIKVLDRFGAQEYYYADYFKGLPLVEGDESRINHNTLLNRNSPDAHSPTATGSTEARTLSDRFADVVHASDYATLQDALNVGGVIHLKYGERYEVTNLIIQPNTTIFMYGATIARAVLAGVNIITAKGASYANPIENISIFGGEIIDEVGDVRSGVIFAFAKNITIRDVKLTNLAKNSTPDEPNLTGHAISGFAISSCVDVTIDNCDLSGFRNDGLIISGGYELESENPDHQNNVKVINCTIDDMAISGIGTNRGANRVLIQSNTVIDCGLGFNWISINGDHTDAANNIVYAKNKVPTPATCGINLAHSVTTGVKSFGKNCKVHDNTVTGLWYAYRNYKADGSSFTNNIGVNTISIGLRVSEVDGLIIDGNTFTGGDFNIWMHASHNVDIINNKLKSTRLASINLNSYGANVVNVPIGIEKIKIDNNTISEYSRDGVDDFRGAITVQSGVEAYKEISITNNKFYSDLPVNVILPFCTKGVTDISGNTLNGNFGSFIKTDTAAQKAAVSVSGNKQLTRTGLVEIYPRVVSETQRGSGATTNLSDGKFYKWSELITNAADVKIKTDRDMTSGANTTVINNFTAALSASVFTYTYAGGGTLSFNMNLTKNVTVV